VLPAHGEAMVGAGTSTTLSNCSQAPRRSWRWHKGRREPKLQAQRRGHPGWAPPVLARETPSPVGHQDEAAGAALRSSSGTGVPAFWVCPRPAAGGLCHDCAGAMAHPGARNWADWDLGAATGQDACLRPCWVENIGDNTTAVSTSAANLSARPDGRRR